MKDGTITMENLKQQTQTLLQHLDELKQSFESKQYTIGDKEEFRQIKKLTLPFFLLLEQWETTALHFTKLRKITVHPAQITATKENYEMLLIHSYFRDIRKRKYMEMYRSSIYVFNQLLGDIENER